jgi:hypothetical protein
MFKDGAILVLKKCMSQTEKTSNWQAYIGRTLKDGKKEYTFSGFVNFVAEARKLPLKENAKVKILACGVVNTWDNIHKKPITKFLVMSAKMYGGQGGSGTGDYSPVSPTKKQTSPFEDNDSSDSDNDGISPFDFNESDLGF